MPGFPHSSAEGSTSPLNVPTSIFSVHMDFRGIHLLIYMPKTTWDESQPAGSEKQAKEEE